LRAPWSAIDPSKKRWVVPAARFKSGSDHIVPLTDDALRIVENLPRFPDCDWLFSVAGRLPPAGFGKVKGRLDKLMRADESFAVFVDQDCIFLRATFEVENQWFGS
jgi:hypothetical protein